VALLDDIKLTVFEFGRDHTRRLFYCWLNVGCLCPAHWGG
jgi:hypothetical protein